MSPFDYDTWRPLIFRLEPEQAHALTLGLLRLGGSSPLGRWLLRLWFRPGEASRPVRAFGLEFPNPVGLAAGYDKDGLGWRGLACLGFGHLELGTVTPRPQPGNPRPRVFRLAADEAVINRMGFPGRGADFLVRRLTEKKKLAAQTWSAQNDGSSFLEIASRFPKNYKTSITNFPVLGVNIGKNKDTPLEEAAGDYLKLFSAFAPLAAYLAVNVSSPNTPGLRSLQSRQSLEGLLAPLAAARADFAAQTGRRVPILVKLAPDLDDAGLDGALEAVTGCGMDGVIQGNTTLARPGLSSPAAAESGGLSGRPLEGPALAALGRTLARLNGHLPVVACGGVMDAAGVRARLDLGAVLVQLYTGLIYRGPGLVGQILREL